MPRPGVEAPGPARRLSAVEKGVRLVYHRTPFSSRGEDFAEYALLVALVAVLVFAVVAAIGADIAACLDALAQALDSLM